MENNEKRVRLIQAIAPTYIGEYLQTCKRIIDAGGDPSKCTSDGKSLKDKYVDEINEWVQKLWE